MKKILSILLITAMVLTMIPYSAMANGTEISVTAGPGYQADVNHNGMVVTPTVNLVSGEAPAGYKYRWYAENNSTHEEYILPWETGASITINAQIPLGWWLNFEVTPLDESGNPAGETVRANHYISTYPMNGKGDSPAITTEQSTAYHDTPAEYTFEVEGVKFILLDRLWNGEYYVMMENAVGKRKFDTDTDSVDNIKFNPSDTNNIGYWLNSAESGNFLDGTHLPSSVQSHITEEEWTFEGDGSAYSGDKRTLKVGLLSYSEYIAYFGRFGLWLSGYDASNPNSWEGWWLRTVSGTRVIASCKNGGADNGSQPMGRLYSRVRPTDGNYHIRPTFHLSADFFEEVTVKNPGARIKELLTDWEETNIEIGAWSGSTNDSRTGITVTPKVNVVSDIKPASYKYQWYIENDLTGEEYILPWETKNSITITSQMPLGWWLNFEVTPYDKNGNPIGKPVKANHYINTYPMKGTGTSPAITSEQSTEFHDTPSEYIFEVNGVKFILLDRLWSGEYYVMLEDGVGKMKFDENDGDVAGIQFDPSDTSNIAYWLNNDFLSGNKLPEAVKSQITEEEWTFEGDSSAYSGEKRTLKVGLLSYSEYIGYFGRFGLWLSGYDASNPNSWEGWWLRTLSGSRVFASCKNGGADNGSQPMGRLYGRVSPKDTNYHIRPTFHLSADFFSTTKIDLAKAGAKVKETIAACGLSTLENIYTKDELIASGTIKKPIISNVGFEGNFAVGATVKCIYVWSSENGVEEGNSSYGFSVSNTPNGTYTNVLTDSKEYTISDEDLGKYLTFYVTPYDKNGIDGDFFRTKPVLIREKAKVIVTECSRSDKKIKITLKNLTADSYETVTVMASAFDESGNLIGCYATKVDIPANQTVTMDNLSLGSVSVSSASVMVWDSLEKMNSIYLSDI